LVHRNDQKGKIVNHVSIEPAIHYWGTPVVLISTLNVDGSANLAPMSSAWWIGWSCMVGLDASSLTAQNLLRDRQGVLNLASIDLADAVNQLALLTGNRPVPPHKQYLGYTHEKEKFKAAGLSELQSTRVHAPRVRECKVQLEVNVSDVRRFGKEDERLAVPTMAFECRIVATHVDPAILKLGSSSHIDPEKWLPLIMKFRHLVASGAGITSSRLAQGNEDMYAPWKAARRAV
jgi:flavin reductase (DIM6/NTAB) family NADH-FMN oxidoreductase RutF